MDRSNVNPAVLKLVDLVFVANLVPMICNAGFERLVQRTPDLEHGSSDEGYCRFRRVKLRVGASMSAIVAIELLEPSSTSTKRTKQTFCGNSRSY
jgi:uncharacterized membrane protein YqhA